MALPFVVHLNRKDKFNTIKYDPISIHDQPLIQYHFVLHFFNLILLNRRFYWCFTVLSLNI